MSTFEYLEERYEDADEIVAEIKAMRQELEELRANANEVLMIAGKLEEEKGADKKLSEAHSNINLYGMRLNNSLLDMETKMTSTRVYQVCVYQTHAVMMYVKASSEDAAQDAAVNCVGYNAQLSMNDLEDDIEDCETSVNWSQEIDRDDYNIHEDDWGSR